MAPEEPLESKATEANPEAQPGPIVKANEPAPLAAPLSQALTFTPEEVEIIRSTVAADASPPEFKFFLAWCKLQGFNPLMRQAYCTKIDSRLVFMASVDGLASRAATFPEFEGLDCYAVYKGDNFSFSAIENKPTKHEFGTERGQLLGAWARIRYKDGRPPVATWVAFSDFNKGKANWNVMPGEMIEKCCRGKVFRRGFPNAFGNVYTPEELGRSLNDGRVVIDAKVEPQAQEDAERNKVLEDYSAYKTKWDSGQRLRLIKTVMETETLPPGTSGIPTPQLKQIVEVLKTTSYMQWAGSSSNGPTVEAMSKPRAVRKAAPPPAPPAPEPTAGQEPDPPEPGAEVSEQQADDPSFDQFGNVIVRKFDCPECGLTCYEAKDSFSGERIGEFVLISNANAKEPIKHTHEDIPQEPVPAKKEEKPKAKATKKRGPKEGSKNVDKEVRVPCDYCEKGTLPGTMAKAFDIFKTARACQECATKVKAETIEKKPIPEGRKPWPGEEVEPTKK